MCRHLGYLGEPVTLSELVLEPPHSLVVQSYAPKDMRGGGRSTPTASARAGPAPVRTEPGVTGGPCRSGRTAAFAELARATTAVGVLAAVRNATVGMPVADAALRRRSPTAAGCSACNGRIDGWPDTAAGLAAGAAAPRPADACDAPTDAALLWAVLRHRLARRRRSGGGARRLVGEVPAAAPGSRLNHLLTDGSAAVRHHRHPLAVVAPLADRRRCSPASRFDDDPAWQPIPDGQLVVADRRLASTAGRCPAAPASPTTREVRAMSISVMTDSSIRPSPPTSSPPTPGPG